MGKDGIVGLNSIAWFSNDTKETVWKAILFGAVRCIKDKAPSSSKDDFVWLFQWWEERDEYVGRNVRFKNFLMVLCK